jgi:hypothetical protein
MSQRLYFISFSRSSSSPAHISFKSLEKMHQCRKCNADIVCQPSLRPIKWNPCNCVKLLVSEDSKTQYQFFCDQTCLISYESLHDEEVDPSELETEEGEECPDDCECQQSTSKTSETS